MSSFLCNHISIAIPFHHFSQSFPKHTLLLPNCFTFPSLSNILNSFMAPQGRTYKLHGFQVAFTFAFFCSLIVLLPQSGNKKCPFNHIISLELFDHACFYILRNMKLDIHNHLHDSHSLRLSLCPLFLCCVLYYLGRWIIVV